MPDHHKSSKHRHRSTSRERDSHKSHSHSRRPKRRHSRSQSQSHSPHRHHESGSGRHKSSHRDSHRNSHRDSHRGSHTRLIKQEIKQERTTPEHSNYNHGRNKDLRSDLRPDLRQVKNERWSPVAGKDAERGGNNRDAYRNERRSDRRRNDAGDESRFSYGRPEENQKDDAPVDKDKPDFALSGKLADESNTFRGIVINYNEPPEARKPKLKWRLYPFKGDEALPVLHIHRQSGYLFGRDRKVADIPVDHPSCSKQHAVLQFRSVEYAREDGGKGRRTRPYIMDLNSANGTYVNNKQIDAQRYTELLEKDTLKFGFSSRDYVILHDNTLADEPSPEPATQDL